MIFECPQQLQNLEIVSTANIIDVIRNRPDTMYDRVQSLDLVLETQ